MLVGAGGGASETGAPLCSMKIGRPVFRQMAQDAPDYVSSDCPIAGRAIMQGIDEAARGNANAGHPTKAHPLTLMRIAYGL